MTLLDSPRMARLAADPAATATWRAQKLGDDPVLQSNTRGMITFATQGPDSRTSQVFVNYGDNSRLDAQVRKKGAVSA